MRRMKHTLQPTSKCCYLEVGFFQPGVLIGHLALFDGSRQRGVGSPTTGAREPPRPTPGHRGQVYRASRARVRQRRQKVWPHGVDGRATRAGAPYITQPFTGAHNHSQPHNQPDGNENRSPGIKPHGLRAKAALESATMGSSKDWLQ